MKIAIIGCSHSGGVYHRDTTTSGSMATITLEGSWPLAIARANPEATIILRPQHGGDVHSLNLHFHALMEEHDPDLFIVQLPQYTRTSFGISKTSHSKPSRKVTENLFEEASANKSETNFLTTGNVEHDNTHWYITRRVHAISRHHPNLDDEEIQTFLKVLRNIHNGGPYDLFQQACTIIGWIDACAVQNRKIIVLNWNTWDSERFKTLSSSMQSRISSVLVHGGLPFKTWLITQYGEDWLTENLVDDDHLNAKAQALLLDFLRTDTHAREMLGGMT
jgi:hypothetical protein